MSFPVVVTHFTRFLLLVALTSTTYLYLYPVWHGCAFPSATHNASAPFQDTINQHVAAFRGVEPSPTAPLAPFRLLVLADPQLEGDSSLPKPEDALLYRVNAYWGTLKNSTLTNLWETLLETSKDLFIHDVPREFRAWRKRLDLFGNDFYLAHIFRSLYWWTQPTHVTVLGDLIGSQWVDNAEFEYRGWRYWHRVFAGSHAVEDDIMSLYEADGDRLLPMEDSAWKRRVINIVGNHDIGYAGDIVEQRVTRFEETFGKVNWDVRFDYPVTNATTSQSIRPSLHLIVLNSMLLDGPVRDESLQQKTYEYLNSIISKRSRTVEDEASFTLLLTHVPLHKEQGICVDGPYFAYFDDDQDCESKCSPGGLKEQNHLSEFSSRTGILQSLLGMSGNLEAAAQGRGRRGLILNGHDHEGCDTWHYIPSGNLTILDTELDETRTNWQASPWIDADPTRSHTGVREITLRSMMGEFGGNAGLLSLWYDFETNQWRHALATCQAGVQHIWWAVHVVDILAVLFTFIGLVLPKSTTQNRPLDTKTIVAANTVLSRQSSTPPTRVLQNKQTKHNSHFSAGVSTSSTFTMKDNRITNTNANANTSTNTLSRRRG